MTTDSILAPVASLTLPDGAALTGRAQQALAFIRDFQIDSAETYGLAADELKAIKSKAKALEDQRTGITGPLNKVLKAVNDLFRAPSETLAEAERLLKGKMIEWDREQERIAAEARRKAEEAAAAERKRLEEEAAARQREAEAQAAAAAKAQAEGDAQAAALAQAAAQRAQAEAQAAATTAQVVVATVVAQEKVKAAGISTAKKVDFEVTNLHELVVYVAAHPELINLLAADSVKLRAYVKGVGFACALPGVRVFEDRVMSARSA
jgi:flagellar biosynthesis GTPase FlhF